MNNIIRIGIVDPNEIVRDGLKIFLETTDDLMLVGEASSADEVIHLCTHGRPDVILFDFLAGRDNMSILDKMRRLSPHSQVLVLSTRTETEYIHYAVRAGAMGYLFKQIDIDDLAQAIRLIRVGHQVFDDEVKAVLGAGV